MSFKIKNLRLFSLSCLFVLSACDVSPILTVLLGDPEDEEEDYYEYVYENTPPVIEGLSITPTSPRTNDDLTVNVIASDKDNSDFTTSYEWKVNNVTIQDETSSNLPSSKFFKDDIIEAHVTVNDGTDSVTQNTSTTILDTLPSLSFTTSPETVYTNTDLIAQPVYADIDNDPLTISFEWSINGSLLSSEIDSTLASSNFSKGDTVSLSVSITDGSNIISNNTSVTISDSSPVFDKTITTPSTATYGSNVSFQVSVSDIDGDTPTYIIHHGPNGMVVNQDGTVTWTPSGPLFDTDTQFNWGITASSGPDASNTIKGSINVIDNNRLRPLSRGKFDVPSTTRKFILADMNNDGKKEILSADSLDTRQSSSTGQRLSITAITGNTYRQLWSYPFDLAHGNGAITSIAAHDINNDNYPEIFVGTGQSALTYTDQTHQPKIIIIDGQSKKIIKSVTLTGRSIASLSVVDLNNNSNPELLTLLLIDNNNLATSRLDIRDLTTLESRWSSPNIRGQLGNIDSDPEPELISSSGLVYDYNGTGFFASWSYNTEEHGFGQFTIGDIDNDGDNEIFAMPDLTNIHIVHSATEATILNYPGFPYPSTLFGSDIFITDIDNDGQNELIGEDIKAFSYSATPTPTLTEKWSQYIPGTSIKYLAFSDYDNDGSNELFWTISTGSTGADQLFISNYNQGLIQEWTHKNPVSFNGHFRGGYLVNTSQTSKELIFASTEIDNSYSESRIIKMNPVTGDLSFSPGLGNNAYSTVAICPADYDNDGIDEVFVGTGESYSPYLSIYDPDLNFSNLAYTETNLATIDQITSADINNDGHLDLVALGRISYFYIYDVFNSTLLWKGTSSGELISESNRDIHVTDLNNDGSDEIIILTTENLYIHSKDLNGNISLVRSIGIKNGSLLSVGHIDGDNQLDITVVHSNQDESMRQITTYTPELVEQYNFTTDLPIIGLQIEEFGEFPKNFTVSVATYNQYPHSEGYIGVINPKTGGEVMRSPLLSMPSSKAIQYVDVDSDGMPEISYGTKDSLNITR